VPLATGRTRYVGEPVAVVVADTAYHAQNAAELVAVDYDPLPAVTDAEAQIVAGELTVPVDWVTILHGDIRIVRKGQGTYGSRSISRGGMAAVQNARHVRDQARRVAAHLLEARPDDVVIEAARFHVRGGPTVLSAGWRWRGPFTRAAARPGWRPSSSRGRTSSPRASARSSGSGVR
jgi:CO/xanthine dehydrogenase Mo-binding subunit